jgi:hypothetical protein
MSILEPLNEAEEAIAIKLATNLKNFYCGKEKGIHGHKIVSGLKALGHTDFTDIRLRKCVNWLRIKGYPICSNTHWGYYWPSCEAEVRECIKSNAERADGILAANKGMLKGITKVFAK